MSSPERSFRRRLARERNGKQRWPRGADAQAQERSRAIPANLADVAIGVILASMRRFARPRARS